MVEVFGAHLAPHLCAGAVERAAHVHLTASIPNLRTIECIQTGGDFHLPLIGHAVRAEDDFVTPPDRPGLGSAVDEIMSRAHPFDGDSLHLQLHRGKRF